MQNKVVLIRADTGDWEALYINGQLKYEGHSMPIDDALYTVSQLGGFAFECIYDGGDVDGGTLLEIDGSYPQELTQEMLDRLR